MLLPGKHISAERSVLGVASRILECLDTPSSVGELWNRFQALQSGEKRVLVGFDWFVLALCALFALGRVSYSSMIIQRSLNGD